MHFERETLDGLFQYCMALCHHTEDAYDLLHNALENYLQQPKGSVQFPLAYIRRSARNRFFDNLRRNKIVSFESLPDADIHLSEERALEAMMVDQLTLRKIWADLSPSEREVLYFWAVQGMSAAEVGLHLELPRGTVLARLKRLKDRVVASYPALGSGG